MKSREFAVVGEQTEIASGIFSLWLETESIAKEAVPGQFVSVYSKDKSRMLPRPISICEIDKKDNAMVFDPFFQTQEDIRLDSSSGDELQSQY